MRRSILSLATLLIVGAGLFVALFCYAATLMAHGTVRPGLSPAPGPPSEIYVGPVHVQMPETPLDLEMAASYARLDHLRQDRGQANAELAHLYWISFTPSSRCNNLAEQLNSSTDPGKRHDLEIAYNQAREELADTNRQFAEQKERCSTLDAKVKKAEIEWRALEEKRRLPSPR